MLATNMFFWDWTGAPIGTVSVVEVVLPSIGVGGARGFDYRPLPDEYWAEREGRMTQDHKTGREIFDDAPAMVSPTPFNQTGISGIAERNNLVASLRDAPNVDSLRAIAARIRDLNK